MAATRKITVTGASGEAHELRFSVNAFCRFEEKTGETIMQAFASLGEDKISFSTLRSLVEAGLSTTRPNITSSEAGDIMDDVGMADMMAGIERAVTAAMPAPEEGAEGNAPAGKTP